MKNLLDVKSIFTHAHCADGIGSALILSAIFPLAKIHFVEVGTPEHKNLTPIPNSLWCDIAPSEKMASAWRDAKTIVLDHHVSNKNIVESFENGVWVNEPGVSGAVLAYRYIWKAMMPDQSQYNSLNAVAKFADLVGIKDTNLIQHPDWLASCRLMSVLTFFPFNFLQKKFPHYNDLADDVGSVIWSNNQEKAHKAIKESYCFECKGLKVMLFSGTRNSSDVANILTDQYDLYVGLGEKIKDDRIIYNYSCRSSTGFNCAEFASTFGGGGHHAAAGFAKDCPIINQNGFIEFQKLFEWYLKDV